MTATNGRTARKVLGSLSVIGAAAAVAGMGTFGSFTDSTAPLNASVAAGTLSIELNATNSSATLPMTATAFVPGDSMSRSVDLVNNGDVDFANLSMVVAASQATAASPLNTDALKGLQLSVSSCSVPWTETKVGAAPTYTCSSGATTLISGPAVASSILPVASTTAKGIDHLVLKLSLPSSADNTFQSQKSELSITFTGSQRTATQR
jgi:hypothetical protein